METGKRVRRHSQSWTTRLLAAWLLPSVLLASPAFAQTDAPPAPPVQPAQGPGAAPPPGYYPPPPPGYYPPPPPGYYPPQPLARANNAVFVELGGNAIAYSVNYERYFTEAVTGRIGLGYFSVAAVDSDSSARASLMIIPMTVNYLIGGGYSPHKFELGGGALMFYASASATVPGSSESESGSLLFGTATAGYRYMPYDGGFLFRVGLTPIIGHGLFLPWFGLSFGVGF